MDRQTNKRQNSNQPTQPMRMEMGEQADRRQPYRYQPQKPTKPQKSGVNRWLLIIPGLVLVTLLLLAVIGWFGANAMLDSQYGGKIEPGVSISGVYVGEMNREQAKTVLQSRLTDFNQRPVFLAYQDKNWQPTLEQLGVSVNYDATVNKAMATGQTGDSRVVRLMNPRTYNLPIEIQVDETKLRGYLSDISDRLRKSAIEPNFEIKDGKITTSDGAEGLNVDFDVTYDAIRQSLLKLQSNTQNLLTVHNVTPVIANKELSDFKGQVEPFLSGPIVFKFKDKSWKLDEKAIARMITVKRILDPKQPVHFTASIDTTQVEKFVTDLRKEINKEPKDAKIAWQNNQVVATEQSTTGQYLVVDKTVDQAIKLLNNPAQRNLDLVVDVREPAIDSTKLDRLGLKEMVSEGVSQFGGSASERAININVGAKYLNGALIKPHSTFSFLDQIGEISAERGYAKGYAIIADQTVPDVGGGICQVATTTFRAAFYAGMPIVERNAHIYRVSWYEEMGEPVGFDAAVYQPGVDFKFENSTDNWMAISAFTKSGRLYVQIWGTKAAGQSVELIKGQISNQKSPPPDRMEIDKTLAPGTKKQVDTARPGLDVTITRIVKVNGLEVKREPFFTRFQAWPNVFKVGPTPAAIPSGNN